MNEELSSAIDEMLDFHGIEPREVEYNCGTVWLTDKTTGKKVFLSFGDCEVTCDGNCELCEGSDSE